MSLLPGEAFLMRRLHGIALTFAAYWLARAILSIGESDLWT